MGNKNGICSRRGCDEKIVTFYDLNYEEDMNSSYCQKCKCKNQNCSNKIYDKQSKVCAEHICVYNKISYNNTPRCNKPILRSLKDATYCEYHACINKRCNQHSSYNVQSHTYTQKCCDRCKCSYHCENSKIDKLNNCGKHKCIIENCSNDTAKKNQSSYCLQHCCNFAYCGKLKGKNINYCENHKNICKFQTFGYGNSITSCENIVKNNYKFCELHKCEIDDCNLCKKIIYKIGFASYCENHNCNVEKCNGLSSPSSKYCTTHRCINNMCSNKELKNGCCGMHLCEGLVEDKYSDEKDPCHVPILNNDYKYCLDHTCKTDNCYKYTENKTYCGFHTIHVANVIDAIHVKNEEVIIDSDIPPSNTKKKYVFNHFLY
jgi:hypothetical protein